MVKRFHQLIEEGVNENDLLEAVKHTIQVPEVHGKLEGEKYYLDRTFDFGTVRVVVEKFKEHGEVVDAYIVEEAEQTRKN